MTPTIVLWPPPWHELHGHCGCAAVDALVRVPAGYVLLVNGVPSADMRVKAGQRLSVWRPPHPHAPLWCMLAARIIERRRRR